MTKNKNQHIIPVRGDWGIKGAGNSRLTAIFDTKQEALQTGRKIAMNQHTELVIHGRNGRIQDKDSYGKDPMPPKDRIH